MSLVAEFQAGLDKRSIGGTAAWFPVDLHNHSPGSFDYRDKGTDAKDRIIQRLIGMTPKPLVVMFTDHEVLPGEDFCAEIARNAGLIVLRGVELNCFVDAYDTGSGNVGRNLFYHLLIGFDPANSHPPDYWLEEIYRECHAEHRSVGTREARGIRATPTDLHKVLAEANAIVIPAHLHSQRNAWKSRSIDDIYQDQEFLRDVSHHFTAIEVTNQRTAAFFDGHHAETNNMRASVIWSSDSHAPDSLGTRMSYLLMEQPSFAEVKAALELPFRTSLTLPPQPSSHIIGVHVQGGFLPDTWVRFAPGCNVLIGSKGSGKTSITHPPPNLPVPPCFSPFVPD